MPGVLDVTGRLRVGLIVIGVLFLLYLSTTIVPAGHVGVQDFFGRVSDRVLAPGINLVMPGTRVIKFSAQTRELKESAAVPTSEGLVVNLEVSLLFRLKPDAAARIYKTVACARSAESAPAARGRCRRRHSPCAAPDPGRR